MKLLQEVFTGSWSITPKDFEALSALLLPCVLNGNIDQAEAQLYKSVIKAYATDPTYLVSRWELDDETLPEGSVAVIELEGVLYSWNTFALERWLLMAEQNPKIVGVVLWINGPGGMVAHVDVVASTIMDMTKPVATFVAGMMASAHFWIGTTADRIVVASPLCEVGSVGVMITWTSWKKYFEKNRSLARRFQNIEIPEPGEEETVRILQGLKPRYEAYHQVVYTDDALTYAVNMSAKYITERYLPDKAIDLMDEAGAWRRLHPLNVKPQTVDRDVIAQVLAKICRIPLESIQTEASDGLETLEARLLDQIYGQDEAVSQVVNAIKFSRAGLLEEDKPLASLLFVGPTGVGKTEVARTLAKELGVKLVRFDMSEYAEKHTVAKLIGAPAGYVGYDEGGLLTEAIRKHPSSVLLLDEIEKAHPDIYNVLLQVMDYATLTDNQGRKADFRNVVVIMTSNAGANRLSKPPIGFQGTHRVDTAILMEEVNRVFQPEFRNRLSRIVTFNSMDETMAGRVVDKKLRELAEQLMRKGVTLTVSDSARKLIEDHGISQLFGAREVERVIRNEVKPLFVDELLFGRLRNGGSLQLDTRDGTLIVRTGEACV